MTSWPWHGISFGALLTSRTKAHCRGSRLVLGPQEAGVSVVVANEPWKARKGSNEKDILDSGKYHEEDFRKRGSGLEWRRKGILESFMQGPSCMTCLLQPHSTPPILPHTAALQ